MIFETFCMPEAHTAKSYNRGDDQVVEQERGGRAPRRLAVKADSVVDDRMLAEAQNVALLLDSEQARKPPMSAYFLSGPRAGGSILAWPMPREPTAPPASAMQNCS